MGGDSPLAPVVSTVTSRGGGVARLARFGFGALSGGQCGAVGVRVWRMAVMVPLSEKDSIACPDEWRRLNVSGHYLWRRMLAPGTLSTPSDLCAGSASPHPVRITTTIFFSEADRNNFLRRADPSASRHSSR